MRTGSLRYAGLILSILLLGGVHNAHAQLAKNSPKFLGNTTTNFNYYDSVMTDFGQYWNQITAENSCKWGSVEATQNKKNFKNCDAVYKYAKQNNALFRFHTLIWGSQLPSWLGGLSKDAKLAAINNWMDSVKAHYPDVDLIDVVNESVAGHAPFPDSLALGGWGTSGYDWVIKSFQMARQRWPHAKLVLNDFNNLRWNVDEFIKIAKAVVNSTDGRSLIDGIGCQAHDLSATTGTYTNPEMDSAALRVVLKKLHDQVGLPIYITELDLSYQDDAAQLSGYQKLFPVFWNSEYVAGITLWGYVYGKTWDQAKYSGLINNGTDRPAFTWLKQYVKDNPNPPAPTASVKARPLSKASSAPGFQMRSIGGRLVLGIESKDGFHPVGPLGRN